MSIRRRILKQVNDMLYEDQISPEEAAFMLGYEE